MRLDERWIAPSKAVVDPDVLALDPGETPQGLVKSRHNPPGQRVILRERHQHADAADLLPLLRAPHKRPCCGRAEHGDELTSSQRSYSHQPVLELAAAIGVVEPP